MRFNGQSTSTTGRLRGQALTGSRSRDFSPTEMFTTSTTPRTINISSETVQDAVLTGVQQTVADVIAVSGSLSAGAATYASSNTAVATIASDGTVTPLTAGSTTITVTVPGIGVRKVLITITQSQVFSGFASGSLGNHLVDQITSLISGKTPPSLTSSPPYANSILNILTNSTTRNTGFWASTVDTTCIPIDGYYGREGVLVTPRDMLSASHFWAGGLASGDVYFMDNSNTIVTRTIATSRLLTSPSGDGGDICAATFTADVPSGITPTKLMPSTIRSYLPQPAYRYPCVFTNQDRTLLIGDIDSIPTGADVAITKPTDTTRSKWWYGVRDYDSGSPAFCVINGALALLTQWHFAGGGPNDSDNITQINAALAVNGSPYTLTTTDLSGFTTY